MVKNALENWEAARSKCFEIRVLILEGDIFNSSA
jgi:hypothetical protein